MKFRSGVLVCAAIVALFASVGFGAWQAKQKNSDKAATSDENPPSHDVATPEVPDVSHFPSPWPAPLAKPSGTPEQVATALAQKVLAGGPDALPALEGAALESGFSIHNSETKAILFSPSPETDIGMSMADFDLFVAAEGAKRKTVSQYGGLQSEIEGDLPDFPLNYLLPHETIEGVYSRHPGYQFFGNFIMQLGMKSTPPSGMDSSRQLRMPPRPEFKALGQDSNAKFNEPQICFLLYMAAGQAWAGSEGGDKKTEEPPAEAPGVPPADEPPPHGPDARIHGQALDAAFRDLRQVLTNLSDTSIAQTIIQNGSKGHSAHFTLLSLAQQRILQVGTKINFVVGLAPLVRTKIHGQTGGTRTLHVHVSFSVPDDVRTKYDTLRSFMIKSNPLPKNGPQDQPVMLSSLDVRIEVNPDHVRTSNGEATTKLIGAVQDQQLGKNPVADDYSTELNAFVPANQPLVLKVGYVPVRDWLPNGTTLLVGICVKGSGRQDLPGDTHLYWAIDRWIVDTTDLPDPIPMSMITPNSSNKNLSSWTQFFNPAKGWADPEPKYEVDDFYIYDGPVFDCASKAGERGQSVENVRSLPWKGNSNTYNSSPSTVEWDSKTETYNFKRWIRKVPTEKWNNGVPDQPRDISILEDVDIPEAAATGNVPSRSALNEEFVQMMGLSAEGANNTKIYQVKSLKDGKGDKTVAVDVVWKIYRPSAKAGGGGGKQPPLSFAEQQALRAKVQELLAISVPKHNSSKNIHHWPDFKPALTTPARAAHGPLWIADPSAATCSEIDIADSLPSKPIGAKRD